MIKLIESLLPDWRAGSFLSRLARVVFEKKQIRKNIGLGLTIFTFTIGVFQPVQYIQAQEGEQAETLVADQKVLTTESTFQRPVQGENSQGFHWYHQAVDISGNDNLEVKPIAQGQVVETGHQFWGFGNYVICKHGEDYTSLYAHLSQINVFAGQEIDKDTVLGHVGSTGRSTGPHLHLEISENGVNLNPYSLIKDL